MSLPGDRLFSLVLTGAAYGYPACCIMPFVERAERIFSTGKREPFPSGPWDNTGYLPCADCRERILKEGMDKFVAEVIAPERECPTPFPIDKE